MSEPLDIHELRPEETDEMLALRNSIFGHISREHWDAMGCTAVLARDADGSLVGAVPFQWRTMELRSKVAIPVVFENAVGVAESHRSQGIGSAIIEHAAQCLSDRADALFVYRGGERSPGYRFYRKTGHGDLFYHHRLVLAQPGEDISSVEVLPAADAVALEDELLAVWRTCYQRFGGFWPRGPGYFAKALASHVYKNDDWRLLVARSRRKITGYAITNPEKRGWGGLCLYDLAASNPVELGRVLTAAEKLARQAGLPLTIPCSRENPLWPELLDRGFMPDRPDTPYIMARILRADRIFARQAENSPLLHSLKLSAVTPHRDVVLNGPKSPKHEATLYLKESLLSRLMTSRLDFAEALRMNLVRITPVPKSVETALGRLFRCIPWISVGLDYV